MVENCDLREPGASRTDPGLLSRVANRHRQKFRPEEPKDLNLNPPPQIAMFVFQLLNLLSIE